MWEPSFFHDALQMYGNHGAIADIHVRELWNFSFSAMKCLHYGKDWKEFDYRKNTCRTFKKNFGLFTIFPDFISIFQTFSRCGKLLCKFQDFSKNSVWTLCNNMGHYRCRNTFIVWFTTRPKHRHRNLRDKGNWESTCLLRKIVLRDF